MGSSKEGDAAIFLNVVKSLLPHCQELGREDGAQGQDVEGEHDLSSSGVHQDFLHLEHKLFVDFAWHIGEVILNLNFLF